MKLVSLNLESFGQFRRVEIPFVGGLNLILGNNEAGKSTVVDAILATLFGLGRRTAIEKTLRARYQPLSPQERFSASIIVETGAGKQFLMRRDFADPRQSAFQSRSNPTEQWQEAGDIDAVLRELRLIDMALFRSTLLITGSQVVIDAENEKAVTRAIGAKLASGEGDVTANQALKKLSERLHALTHKERKAALDRRNELEARRRELIKLEADLAQLEDEAEHAEDEAAEARAYIEKYRPIVDSYREAERIAVEYQAKLENQQALLAELGRARAALEELERAKGELSEFTPEAREALTEANLTRLAELDARLAELARSLDDTRRRKKDAEQEAATLEKRLEEAKRALEQANHALFTRERLGEIRAAIANTQEVEKEVAERAARLEHFPVARTNWMLATLGSMVAALSLAVFLAPSGALAEFPPALPITGAILAAILLGVWAVQKRRAILNRRRREDEERQLAEAKRRLDQARLRFDQVSAGYSPQQFEVMLAEVEEKRQAVLDLEAALKLALDRGSVLRPDQLAETERTLREQRQRILETAGANDTADFQARWQRYNSVRARVQQGQNSLDAILAGRSIEELEAAAAAVAADVFTLKNAHDTAKARVAMFNAADIFSWEERLGALNLPVLEERASGLREKLNDFRNRIVRDDPLEIEDALTAVADRLARQDFEAKALELAIATLRDAMEEVQENLVPRIERRAAELLRRLTGGRHGNLRLVAQPEGLEITFPRQADAAGQLGRHHLSSATADQLYLSLRIALAEALFDAESAPLIVDDPFLTYDAERFRAGCLLLAEIAESRQVIWVTKDREAMATGLLPTSAHVVDLNVIHGLAQTKGMLEAAATAVAVQDGQSDMGDQSGTGN